MVERIFPDTSVIVDGKIVRMLERGELKAEEVVVPLVVVEELQAQASKGRDSGFIGLRELKRLRAVGETRGIKVSFSGTRPSLDDIKLARSGRIDALIMDMALKEGGTLVTADYVQALTAEANGAKVVYIPPEGRPPKLKFEKYFTPDTMSVHLKAGAAPMAKRGKPGASKLVKLRERPLTEEEMENTIREIHEVSRLRGKGLFEISMNNATVIQLGDYRIAVARPPFSDGLEVTIVRPVVKLRLDDYGLSPKLLERLRDKAEGILIAGPPGSGKTTFASSLAQFYMAQDKIVKTLEAPRDLQVGPEITQYAPLEGSFEKTADILLLVRPDYTVFDEIRKTQDFKTFADMRLAGVGMIGVTHASSPIDAIQRFIGRTELGMIPHIVDTLIFLRYGTVEKVYELSLTVKVPTGMTDEALTRPVIEIRDFESGRLEYEVYTFGEENIIVPVAPTEAAKVPPARRLAETRILEEIRRLAPKAEVELVSSDRAVIRADSRSIPMLIGREGANISKLEKKLGIRLDVRPLRGEEGKPVKFSLEETKSSIDLLFDPEIVGSQARVYVDGKFLFAATVGKKARIRVSKRSPMGWELGEAITEDREITVTV
ncbi:PINc/VapC family ATPase [Candidatus Hecatella orcuttiae]|jgi:ATPase|uniref:PINc/VapC family ATPase n=1 Tax=Candidatus Hecatella orcuttiae TaxID=1935119 RepID=UPI00286812A2|nr:PINc/VapC family ATPase [Candidatus Hecatella orcuttiae]